LPQGQQFQGCETTPGLDFIGTQDLIGYTSANSAVECCRKCYDDANCSAPAVPPARPVATEKWTFLGANSQPGTRAAHFSWWSADEANNRHALHLTLDHLTLVVQRNILDYRSSCCAPFCVPSDSLLPSDLLLKWVWKSCIRHLAS